MLELRPNCEMCDRDLPADAPDAMICTYECTFCADCVQNVLHNVCPNCAGGFMPRPVRPRVDRRPGTSLTHQPASTKRRTLNYDMDNIHALIAATKDIPPDQR